MPTKWLGIAAVSLCIVGAAIADPCQGELPSKAGVTFSGTVRYVGDGDSICVGVSADPKTWIEVRLADFDAPELSDPNGALAKELAVATLKGRRVECVVARGRNGRTLSYDRVFGLCRVDGVGAGDILRRAGAPTGGN